MEIEPNGEIATFFENDALEARLEITHALATSKHIWGIQLEDREFSVTGTEAFVPAVDSENLGAFWLSERDLDGLSLEMGLRVEQGAQRPKPPAVRRTSPPLPVP